MNDAANSSYTKDFKKYSVWAAEVAAIWVPGAGIVAKLIEKAPLEDVEIWLRSRAPGGHVDVTEPVAMATDAVVGSGDPAPEALSPQPPPAHATLEVDDLLRQYVEVRESEPFRAALGSALDASIARLEHFMQETTCFEGGLGNPGNGLWPAFALEWKLRRSLSNKLGASAIVSDHPAVRSLVEADLAAGLIDAMMGPLAGTPKQPYTVERLVRIFAASPAYRWPRAEGLRPGYVMANVTSPLSLSVLDLKSNAGRSALARVTTPPMMDVAVLEQDADVLISRLGGLSVCGRDELTRAWLRSCVASEMSERQRKASGMAPNPLLSRLQHPLIHIDDKDLLEEIRDDVEATLGAPEPTLQFLAEDSVYTELDAITQAFATNDAGGFDKAVTSINTSPLVASQAAIKERVGRVVGRLRQARGWA
ncbi:hypothetical protein [Bradyrhizobium sp.]|jgi:hypothetical protein|uniref:hypothetical protein n=1 Tax=Bradyrhizobium sp. TaxID=376 RepID=UPI002DDD539D|nr:hypothetical protein [Bradyrhizobium sp.]HEV2157372.1 hypothetical protein [Bradyrhizobium sp.]